MQTDTSVFLFSTFVELCIIWRDETLERGLIISYVRYLMNIVEEIVRVTNTYYCPYNEIGNRVMDSFVIEEIGFPNGRGTGIGYRYQDFVANSPQNGFICRQIEHSRNENRFTAKYTFRSFHRRTLIAVQ